MAEPETIGGFDRIALDDDESRRLVPVWQNLLGIVYMAAQYPREDIEALIAEFDRTDRMMSRIDPDTYRQIADNVEANRLAARAFLVFQSICRQLYAAAEGKR